MPNALSHFISRLFSPMIESTVRKTLAITEDENTFLVGTRRFEDSERDRLEYNRQDVLEGCLEAWRDSPLARRIVEITTQYVIGSGFDIKCQHDATRQFVDQFWNHRLNRMSSRMVELADELTRTGNLFLLISTDPAGMSYIRAIPATDIDRIVAAENDIEQPVTFITKAGEDLEPHTYPAYDQNADMRRTDGTFQPVVLHYAINRPAGAQWGEPDLAPLLPWLRRYSAWLEDRVRLNRFRNAFLYVITGEFASEPARAARQAQLAANPPGPGSILVCDKSETWSVISPTLEARDAMQDGLALKKLIAAGVGLPLHFLAEPEGSNRTTAESAGGPTFRRFEQRQRFFMWLLSDLLEVVIERRALVDQRVDPQAEVALSGSDISARDNVAHSIAAVNILNAYERLKDMGLVSDRELLRVLYRFAGEAADIDSIIQGGSGVDLRGGQTPIQPVASDPISRGSGEPKKSILAVTDISG